MTAAQDMYIDLMHVLYVYSRVMGGGGGGEITKYSRGAGTCMYMWYPRHLQNTSMQILYINGEQGHIYVQN